jgi:hypothetical protein
VVTLVKFILEKSTKIARRNSAVGESLAEDFLVLNLDDGSYYGVGEVGGFAWQRLDGSKTLGELADEVSRYFDVTVDQALVDLIEFARNLIQQELVEVKE